MKSYGISSSRACTDLGHTYRSTDSRQNEQSHINEVMTLMSKKSVVCIKEYNTGKKTMFIDDIRTDILLIYAHNTINNIKYQNQLN